MLIFDDFFLLQKPFMDALGAQLPLPATLDMYALGSDGTMHSLCDHLLGTRQPVAEKMQVLTQPWIAEGQLVFPFPLSSGEMVVAVVSDIDPAFLRKMSASWLRDVRTMLLEHWADIRLSCIDPETELYNQRALTFFLQNLPENAAGFFFLINTVFYRRTAAGNLQKLRETAGLLQAMGSGQYFSIGYGVYGLYLPVPSRRNALKTARNLQHQLRREGMSKVQIGFARVDVGREIGAEKVQARYWRALAIAEQRGPFGMCDVDAIDDRHPHPFTLHNSLLFQQGKQQWRRLRCFTLALFTFGSATEVQTSWIASVAQNVATIGGTVISAGDQILLLFPDLLEQTIVNLIEAVAEDGRKRFGSESFYGGVASWPCLDFTKSDIVGNCLKAQRHAFFLGPGSVVFFDQLSLNISGDYYFDEGDYRNALREYRRGLQLEPGNVNLLNSLGVTLVECSQLRGAAHCFESALQKEPENYMALVNLGRVRQTLGQPDLAKQCLERAFIAHGDDVIAGQELFFPLARLYAEAGLHDRAIAVLDQWGTRPGSEEEFRLFRLRGLCFWESDRPDEAMQACQKALRLYPQDSISLSILGLLYVEQEEGSEVGLSLCDKALSLDNFNPDHWYRLGRAYWHTGRHADAREALQRCLQLQRNHPAAVVLLGRVYQDLGRWKLAKKNFLRALALKGCPPTLADRIRGYLVDLPVDSS
jgi:tetratricopeptide (TPR) repeat protein